MWTFGEQLALEGLLEPRKEPAPKTYHGYPLKDYALDTPLESTKDSAHASAPAQRYQQCQLDLK